MLPNLAVLQKKCQDLGIAVKNPGKRPQKAEYVEALRASYLKDDYPNGLPYTEYEPMLCFPSWHLKPEELAAIWASDNWIAEPKENGCRLILHLTKNGAFCHSRTVSRKNYRFAENTSQLLWGDFQSPIEITLDVEVIVEKSIDTRPYTAKGEVTKTSLHSTTALLALEAGASKRCQLDQDAPLMFKVLDVIKYDGRELLREPLANRLKFQADFFAWVAYQPIGKYFIQLARAFGKTKEQFLKDVWARGGEGVVLKNLRAPYEDSSSRSRTGWVKVKKRKEVDAFVTGFLRGNQGSGYENLVGSLEFSVYLKESGKTHAIGFPASMTLEDRKAWTVYDPATDTVTLHPSVYGRVAEISGQDISARELRLSHCTLDRWRDQAGDEKSPEQCVMSLADLEQMAEWVG